MKIKIIVLSSLAIFILAGCQNKNNSTVSNTQDNKGDVGKIETENKAQNNEKNQFDFSKWKIYKNEKYDYEIKYPKEWFFVNDYCCPPPPSAISFNNYSSKKMEYASHQFDPGVQGIEIVCNYEGKINEIGEVQYFRNEKIKEEEKKINNFNAVRFEQESNSGSSITTISYYIVDGRQGCRLNFENTCMVCEGIVSTFAFTNK